MLMGGEQGGTAPHEMPIATDLGILPNLVRVVTLTDAVDSGCHFQFQMPADAVAATAFVLRPHWAPVSTDASAHVVAWRFATKIIETTDPTAAGTVDTLAGDSAARTANVPVLETGKTVTITPSAGNLIRVAFGRDGAGTDTYVGDVNLLGLRIDYTAVG
jgi:hypothetical protein